MQTRLNIRVECYAGYKGEQEPRRFFLGARGVEVITVLDRWLEPEHGYFKVRGDDGAVYILRHDIGSGRWEMTLFDSAGDRGTLHSPAIDKRAPRH